MAPRTAGYPVERLLVRLSPKFQASVDLNRHSRSRPSALVIPTLPKLWQRSYLIPHRFQGSICITSSASRHLTYIRIDCPVRYRLSNCIIFKSPSLIAMAERILMNEFKTLLKEKWVHVQVCSPRHYWASLTLLHLQVTDTSCTVARWRHLQLGCRFDRDQPRLIVLRWLF